jgi:hypothetical protein
MFLYRKQLNNGNHGQGISGPKYPKIYSADLTHLPKSWDIAATRLQRASVVRAIESC